MEPLSPAAHPATMRRGNTRRIRSGRRPPRRPDAPDRSPRAAPGRVMPSRMAANRLAEHLLLRQVFVAEFVVRPRRQQGAAAHLAADAAARCRGRPPGRAGRCRASACRRPGCPAPRRSSDAPAAEPAVLLRRVGLGRRHQADRPGRAAGSAAGSGSRPPPCRGSSAASAPDSRAPHIRRAAGRCPAASRRASSRVPLN